MSEETVKFHETVKDGSLIDLKSRLEGGVDVNAPGHTQQTALMVAIAAKDLEKMKLLIQYGADPELTNEFNSTSLRYAVDYDFANGVRYLLSLGVDRGYHPKYPLKKIDYGSAPVEVPMPEEMKGVMSEKEWRESIEQTQETIREIGQNPTVEPIIADVQSVEVLELFLAAGDDLNQASTEVKRLYVGLGNEGEFQSSPEDYRNHKSPRYGTDNPERMDNSFWNDMIRIGGSAYSAREQFHDDDPFSKPGAVWCYDRFGSSLTVLDDGRFVQIGGEHEDYYDPDFQIYNDVVIHDGQGNFEIYGYPRELFPPTDFHTATLIGDVIYIIGCLGYPEQRVEGATPVYRLKLESWEIEAIETSGENPGWLHKHRSTYEPEKNSIRVEGGERQVIGDQDLVSNEKLFELDLTSFQWRRLID